MSKPTFKVGPVEVKAGTEAIGRMAVLLWGAATCGKSTFAATAPGKKLWLSFGDNEHVSVAHRDDVLVADLSKLGVNELFKHASSENPFGLDQILSAQREIETVVCDSATALAYMALQHSVDEGVGKGRKGFVPTLMEPGQAAYGGRNALVLKVLTGLLRVTAKHEVHCIITAHEGDEKVKIEDGKEVIDFISVMLGGQLVNNMTWRLSEIWFMSQSFDVRKLAIRNGWRRRKPMKTRMFDGMGDPEFILKYDAHKPDNASGQMTIERWFDEWHANGGKKIMPPKMERHDAQGNTVDAKTSGKGKR